MDEKPEEVYGINKELQEATEMMKRLNETDRTLVIAARANFVRERLLLSL